MDVLLSILLDVADDHVVATDVYDSLVINDKDARNNVCFKTDKKP
jgi:hypothetical protein